MKIGNPSITREEKFNLFNAIEKGEISAGEFISLFEEKWSIMNNRKYGVSCNSGTSAIELALMALGIGKGMEVIVPEFTMVATAFAVSNVGAKPIFVDCLDDLTLDPADLKSKITDKTKAIIIVPIYGRPVAPEVYNISLDRKLFIIEDFAEAHGIMPKGDITCYSFQANKIITTGEGGMCITNDERTANEIRKLASLYFDKDKTMLHGRVAHNFKMTNLQAAIGLAQCNRFEELKNKRIQIAEWYDTYIPEEYKMPKREVVWVYDIQCDQGATRWRLKETGIECRYGFKPMSMQSMYLSDYESLNAFKWSKRILYLPTYFDMTEEDVMEVCKHL